MSAHRKSGCPLCGRELGAHARMLEVCGPCGNGMDRLHRAVSATGEFTAIATPDDVTEDDVIAALDREVAPAPPGGAKRCSGCGKAGAEVKKLLEAPGLVICDECVRLCADILDAELGEGWR